MKLASFRSFAFSMLLATFCLPRCVLVAQTAVPTPEAVKVAAPSSMLQPALGTLRQTLDLLHVDKWKTSNATRDETMANIGSIRHDLDTTLPPLLADADTSPSSVAHVLPVFRNIGALYDVLLRVAAAGRLYAPGPQSTALEQAMVSLEEARRNLGDGLTVSALAQEKQVSDLQAALRAVPPSTPPAAVTASPLPPARSHKSRTKPAPKAPSVPVQ